MRQLRAVLVLLHVLAITAMAAPAPVSGMNKKYFASRDGQAQLSEWAAVFRGVGVEVSDEEFGEQVWAVGRRWLKLCRDALRPLRPYYKLAGTKQGWRMFAIVGRQPTRLEILVDRGGGFERIYASGVGGEQWRSRQLDQERVRAFLSGHAYLSGRRNYTRFVENWVAPTLFADDPEVRAVRVQLRRRGRRSAARIRAGDAPPEKLEWALTVERP